ncbi:MAG: hypothetical protein IJ083_05335 [Clostridia bacterium]|nr:hypothetical protein [Clostridia bacterium]
MKRMSEYQNDSQQHQQELQQQIQEGQRIVQEIARVKEGLSDVPAGLDDDLASEIGQAVESARNEAREDMNQVISQKDQVVGQMEQAGQEIGDKISDNNRAASQLEGASGSYGASEIGRVASRIQENTSLGESIQTELNHAAQEAESALNSLESEI